MKASIPKILVVIPVYNHGTTLRTVTEQALQTGFDVLVVDDGSTDNGTETIGDLNCRTHTLPVNSGKGTAILAGATIAAEKGYDAIITIDADDQHDPAAIPLLAEETTKQWPIIVLGNRRMDTDNEDIPRSSLFGRSFSNFWVRLETGFNLPDTQSGMRLYPVAELLRLSLGASRYDFEIECLVKAAWAGVPVKSVSVPVHYQPEGKRISHFDKLKDNVRLSLLHTRLVTRALLPWPHKKLVQNPKDEKQLSLLLHPVQLFKLILKEHATPLQLATAIWMGIFLGAVPLIAVHTVVIIYVCHKLHLNKMAAVAASQLCMPPVVPFICIQAGYLLRHGEFLTDFNKNTLVLQVGERLWEYLIGSLVVGPLLGLLIAIPAFFIFRFFRSEKKILGAGKAEQS